MDTIFEINTGDGHGNVIDEAEAKDLDAALVAAKTLASEGQEVVTIFIRLKPGHKLVNGEPLYSADWL